jgi:hypothetical protein
MSLKTDFYDGSTGLLTQCDTAFAAGSSFVTGINLTSISNDLKSQAALGLTTFTLTYQTTYNPVAMRGNKGNNLILKAYLAGIQSGLATQNIYDYEVSPSLNISDTVTTSIDLNFTFQTM